MVENREWSSGALRQIGVADTYVVVTWTKPRVRGSITAYLVRDHDGRAAEFVEAGTQVALVDNLDPGTSYRLTVAALTDIGWSTTSPGIWVKTSGRKPKPPRPPRKKSRRSAEWESLSDYLEAVQAIPLLTAEEELELASQTSQGDSDGPFWTFVLANLRLVIHWAKKSARAIDGTLLEIGDLIQAGTEGLVNAVERFDASRGFKFSTYGSWWIRQAMSREIPPMARAFYLPVHIWDAMETLRREMEQDNTFAHLDEDGIARLADQLQMDVDKVRLLLRVSEESVSLEDILIEQEVIDRAVDLVDDEDLAWRTPLLEGEEAIPEWRVEEALHDGGARRWDVVEPWELEALIDRILVEPLFSEAALSSRDQAILEMRYGLGELEGEHTLEEIGERFNLTRERIRQLAAGTLSELREMIGPLDDW